MTDALIERTATDAPAWRAQLGEHHANPDRVWLAYRALRRAMAGRLHIRLRAPGPRGTR
jgi:hypothetical protein